VSAPRKIGAQKPREIEAKFDASAATFRSLERLEELDGWRVSERRSVRLRDSYWDTPDQRLARDECTLRVRELDGAPQGELTFKGKPVRGGRTEETVSVRAGTGPRQWQRVLEARPILDAMRAIVPLSQLRQDVVLLNPRRELVLRKGRAEEVLSLDEMRIEGHAYAKRYVELELKRGARAGHDALARALAERFSLKESKTGKVQAARDWLAKRTAGQSG
jgi:inorganic triphosphatase YgiF